MTEQKYRVIADRDKGDDPTVVDAEDGDLVIYRCIDDAAGLELVRIERPVPTTEVQDSPESANRSGEIAESVPTREQIAEALWRSSLASTVSVTWEGEVPWLNETTLRRVDAFLEELTLVQKGTHR